MDIIEQQKLKLEQKKNRLIAEETRLKLKMRKSRTRHLIELGGLVTKAGLDHLSTNTLYGAMIVLKGMLEDNSDVKDIWTQLGKEAFDVEKQSKSAVILSFSEEPSSEIRNIIRSYSLKYNRFRKEWYGEVTNLKELENSLAGLKYNLELFDA